MLPLLALHCLTAHADVHALLIGVEDYGTARPRLSSTEDVRLLREALLQRGLPEDNIRVLLDAAAPPDVEDAVRGLAAQAAPGDHLLVHFSGHGQQVEDDNGDEADGLDEALVLASGAVLRDDALAGLIAALRDAVGAEGSVAVTLDACSTGTMTRGRELPLRGLPSAASVPLLDAPRDAPGAHVVLSAAAPGGLAYEVYGSDGAVNGAFSAALADAIALSRANQTWEMLFARVRGNLSIAARQQRPLLEGDRHAPVLGGAAVVPAHSVMVAGVISDTEVRLDGGTLSGLAVGARVEVHLPEATAPGARETLLTSGTVTRADTASAFVTLDDPGPARGVLLTGRAFITGGGPSSVIRVRIDIEDAVAARAWAEAISAQPLLALTERAADLVLYEDGRAVLLREATDAEPIGRAQRSRTPEQTVLMAQLRQRARAHLIQAVQLDGPQYALDTSLMLVQPSDCGVLQRASESTFHPDDTIRLRLEHVGSVPAYITVIHIDAEGTPQMLFPAPGEQAPLLPPESVWDVPVCWSPGPPFGTEQLRVLATRLPLDLGPLFTDPDTSRRGSVAQDGYTLDLFLTTAPGP